MRIYNFVLSADKKQTIPYAHANRKIPHKKVTIPFSTARPFIILFTHTGIVISSASNITITEKASANTLLLPENIAFTIFI